MLRIEHLSKTYKSGKKAVQDVCLHVEPGDIYGFIGHNGAGKTTTIRCCAGVLPFEGGDIFVGGKSITAEPVACKQSMAYVPDNPELYEHLTGMKYLNFIADMYGVGTAERKAKIEEYASLLELDKSLGSGVASYSHGMKQKLALIAALIHSPRLLMLDEPFVGLDPMATHILKELMHKMCADGCAVFFSTHVLEVAEKLCNKVAVIQNGRIAVSGPTDQVVGDKSLEELFLELVENG